MAVAIPPGTDLVILGAAVTADAAREAREPETILSVNLASLPGILSAARAAGVRRVINLSSAAAYGSAPATVSELDEAMPCDPTGLYGITKLASERVAARLGNLWELDVASVRLSAVFGPWERSTGVRDTLSPQAQMLASARGGHACPAGPPRPAGLDLRAGCRRRSARPGDGPALDEGGLQYVDRHVLERALAWGEALSRHLAGFVCRLATGDEAPTIALHAATDRPPLATARLAADTGWSPKFDCASSAAHLAGWWTARHPRGRRMRLRGHIAVVTGAGSGIGRATASLFVREGAAVALVDRDVPGAGASGGGARGRRRARPRAARRRRGCRRRECGGTNGAAKPLAASISW